MIHLDFPVLLFLVFPVHILFLSIRFFWLSDVFVQIRLGLIWFFRLGFGQDFIPAIRL